MSFVSWCTLAMLASAASSYQRLEYAGRLCRDQFEANLSLFAKLGTNINFKPGSNAWTLSAGAQGHSGFANARRIYEVASQRLYACRQLGHRYWSITFLSNGQILTFALCLPNVCSETDIYAGDLTEAFQRISDSTLDSGIPKHMVELGDWSDLQVDFVIVGMDKCGCSTLRRNLMQHPAITFTHGPRDYVPSSDEDYSFMQYAVLPEASFVDNLNGKVAYMKQRHSAMVVGMNAPTIWFQPVQQLMLLVNQNVKLILLVCNLVGRLHDKGLVSQVDVDSPWSLHTTWKALNLTTHAYRGETLTSMVDRLLWLFGGRLLVVRRPGLEKWPWHAYNRIAAFLGIAPFPAPTMFCYKFEDRSNLGLCGNESLVSWLTGKATDDHRWLGRLIARKGHGTSPPLGASPCRSFSDFNQSAPLVGPSGGRALCPYIDQSDQTYTPRLCMTWKFRHFPASSQSCHIYQCGTC